MWRHRNLGIRSLEGLGGVSAGQACEFGQERGFFHGGRPTTIIHVQVSFGRGRPQKSESSVMCACRNLSLVIRICTADNKVVLVYCWSAYVPAFGAGHS